MARAPNPKTLARQKADTKAITITVRGEEAIVRPGDFGARDGALVRRETKLALGEKRSLLGALQDMDEQSIDLDSICLLWWLARRKVGDTNESYAEALDRFPTYDETDEIDFSILEDDEDESPEG